MIKIIQAFLSGSTNLSQGLYLIATDREGKGVIESIGGPFLFSPVKRQGLNRSHSCPPEMVDENRVAKSNEGLGGSLNRNSVSLRPSTVL
jgi:hypothetical protein